MIINQPHTNEHTSKMPDLPAMIFSYHYNPHSDDLSISIVSNGLNALSTGPDAVNDFLHSISIADLKLIKQQIEQHNQTGLIWRCDVISTNSHYGHLELTGKTYTADSNHITGSAIVLMAGEKFRNLIVSEKKLESLNRLHNLIINFSTLLIKAEPQEVDETVRLTLEKLGLDAEVDRVYIFEHIPDEDVVNNTFEWCKEGIEPQIENLQGIPFDVVPRWKEKFNQNEHVYIPRIAEIAPEYHIEKEVLEPQGIISLLALPMYYGNKFFGFIGFDSVVTEQQWSESQIALLRLAGEIIAGTIHRARFEKEILAAKSKAEEASKAKSEFLATMSHEIRTPMNAILGFSEILLNTTSDEKQKQYLNAVLSSGRTLLSLINDILDLSKIESGQLEIMEQAVNLKAIIEEILQIFQARAAEKGLYLQAEIEEGLPETLLLDDVRIRQVLFNLVGNAVKFTQEGGIVIHLKAKKSPVAPQLFDLFISIADTGAGIAETMQEKIFQSFFQIESDNTRKYGGTGLGLSISQKLMQVMGGSLLVDSTPGKGSTFTMQLKSVEVSSNRPQEQRSFDWAEKDIHFDDALILVVDDVRFNRELAKSFLHTLNLRVIEAETGTEGIEMCKQHLPDLVLMDLRMPEMNGYEATQILRQSDDTKHIPIVAFTASSMKHDEILIRKLFSYYLRKPISRGELLKALAQFLPHQLIAEETTALESVVANSNETLNPLQTKGFLESFETIQQQRLEALKSFFDPDLANDFLKQLEFDIRQYALDTLYPLMNRLGETAETHDYNAFLQALLQLENCISQWNNQQSPE